MGNPRAIRIFGDLIKSHNPNFIFLSETLVGKDIEGIAEKFGYASSFTVDKVGRSGGLAILWKRSVSCNAVDSSLNHIDGHVMESSGPSWRLTCYYGYLEAARRREAWDMLRRDKVRKQKEVLDMLKDRDDDLGIQQYFVEKNKLNDLLFYEEQYWRQRAKSFWLTEGDTELKFFHSATTKRKKKNHINHLINEDGDQITEREGMKEMVVDYFRNVFARDNGSEEQEVLNERRVITDAHNAKLTADIKIEELFEAIRQMHPNKSAGPDGYSPAFVQHFWDILGPEIFRCCSDWLKNPSFPANLNDTTLVLIPKKERMWRS
ncbi:hypothetical protein AgCh_013045 [Apium graveolens]